MGKGDRRTAGVGGGVSSGSEGHPGMDVPPQEEEELTFAQAAKRAWVAVALALLVVGLVLVLVLEPAPKINNKTVIEKQQTRVIQSLVPGPTIRSTSTVIEVKPGPTVTKTATPRPTTKPTLRPSPHPSPTPTCQVLRLGGLCVGAR